MTQAKTRAAGGAAAPGAEIDGADPAPVTVRRRGGVLYLVSGVISQAGAVLRYVVLARLLGPEQLGIAATLIFTTSFFEIASDMGMDRFIIQDRHGGTTQVQELVQFVSVARGAAIALMMLLFAAPIAFFYHTPQLIGGLAVLAVSPFIGGFAHLDTRRVQREHDFRPEAIATTCGDLVGLVATVAAAFLVHNYTAVLFGVISRVATNVVTTHLLSKRPYRLAWEKGHGARLMGFAAPLMMSGFMVFLFSQGDRVIVGHQLGVKTLGYYSAVILLIYYPAALVMRYLFAINIPLIAAERDDAQARQLGIDRVGGQTLLLSIGMAVGFAIVAPVLVPILFGHRFAQAPLLVGLIGCLQTSRLMFSWPTTVALAIGRSSVVLISNFAHGFAFAGALAGQLMFGGLGGLVTGFVSGEMMAVAVALALVNRTQGDPLFNRFDRIGACVATYALIVGWNDVLTRANGWEAAGMGVGTIALIAWLLRREHDVIVDTLAMVRRHSASILLRLRPR